MAATIDDILREAEGISQKAWERHDTHAAGTYIAIDPTYQAPSNPHYRIFDPYTPRFLGKAVEFGTSSQLGWGGGLFGLNYVGTANKFVSWDESRRHGLMEGAVAAHEHKHDGPLFHGHNLAEYWNRKTDQPMARPEPATKSFAPRYELTYKF